MLREISFPDRTASKDLGGQSSNMQPSHGTFIGVSSAEGAMQIIIHANSTDVNSGKGSLQASGKIPESVLRELANRASSSRESDGSIV